MHGLFVTGTDTGVGKTAVSGAIVAALLGRDAPVVALKPLVTGLDEPPEADWPRDHELLAWLCDVAPGDVTLAAYGPPVSPHLAAEMTGRPTPPVASIGGWVRGVVSARSGATVIVEGVGGLLVPLGAGAGADVRALAAELGLPLIVVARPGLGTINHTLLTLEAARTSGLTVAGVVLNPWPRASGDDRAIQPRDDRAPRRGRSRDDGLGVQAAGRPAGGRRRGAAAGPLARPRGRVAQRDSDRSRGYV